MQRKASVTAIWANPPKKPERTRRGSVIGDGFTPPQGSVKKAPAMEVSTKYSAMAPGLSVLSGLLTMMRASAVKAAEIKPMR